jgi:hypothetical protein
LLYTHQQYLSTYANYKIKQYETQLSQLLDRHKKLMYNVTTLEAPANLEAKLNSNGIDCTVPRRWAVVREVKSEVAYELTKVAKKRNVVLERILNFVTVKAEAQALEN